MNIFLIGPTALFGKVYRTLFQSNSRRLAFKTGVIRSQVYIYIQPVSFKRYFRCNNCVLLLVYAINLSLSTDLVDPYGENTFSVKPPLY